KPFKPPFREVLNQVVETAPPAERARHDVGRQRAVAFVGEFSAASRQRGGKVGPVVRDRPKCPIRRNPCGRDHRPVSRDPTLRECPERKSRTDMGRRPSSCSSSIATCSPKPAAT